MESKNVSIIIVIYNRTLDEVPFFKILNDNLEFFSQYHILIYDNSEDTKVNISDLPNGVIYHNDTNNSGLAIAYNWGIQEASKCNTSWLLLLDHDTTIPLEYFEEVKSLINDTLPSSVKAIIPVVKASGRVIAPVSSSIFNYHKPVNKVGLLNGMVTGINSGTFVEIDFLKSIGGFNLAYPLDYLDHWFFDQIYANNLEMYVVDTIIEQDLSIDDFSRKVSNRRYTSIMDAKNHYYNSKGKLFTIRNNLFLLKNCIVFLVFKSNKSFFNINLKLLLKNIKAMISDK